MLKLYDKEIQTLADFNIETMPKIFLKPKSAEFAESQARHKAENCSMPGCVEIGDHRAPKDRGLDEYYWFCLDHVRDYNKAWNFFEGMSDSEVEKQMLRSLYGDRPTWRYDIKGAAEDILRKQAWNEYNFTEDGQETFQNGHNDQTHHNHQTPEFEALAIMSLEPPVTLAVIKDRYKLLVKKHHPDLNRGCEKSEELLKSINMAYTILKLSYKKFEELPDKD